MSKSACRRSRRPLHPHRLRSYRLQAADIPTISESSLQLTLEAPEVRESEAVAINRLLPIVGGRENVIDFAYAVNGRVSGAELYASKDLFARMWPKLLRAAAVEALSERKAAGTPPPVSADAVRRFLAEAERGRAHSQGTGERTVHVTRQAEGTLLFESRDCLQGGAWIHRSYLAR